MRTVVSLVPPTAHERQRPMGWVRVQEFSKLLELRDLGQATLQSSVFPSIKRKKILPALSLSLDSLKD